MKSVIRVTLASLVAASLAFSPGLAMAGGKTHHRVISGTASWYGPGFNGRRTANGERYNMHALTAAHKTLPFGTKVKVTNRRTGKSVIVRINDRGPYVRSRVIDLSRTAARDIGLIATGTAPVTLEVLG